jgi:hypothetical protein
MNWRVLLALGALVLSGACHSAGSGDDPPTAAPSPTSAPSPTATPDPLGPPPADAAAAVAGLTGFFASQPGAGGCADRLKSAWGVFCLEGDVDGDGKADAAYLVPIHPAASAAAAPAVVVLRRARGGPFERFPAEGDADASALGLLAFSIADRNGDLTAEISYLRNSCTATACSGLVQIQSWDGTAWRDIGPGDDGVVAVSGIEFTGKAADTKIAVRGGKMTAPGAGPTRPVSTTYQLNAGRYRVAARSPAVPEYLYHAVLDADALFDLARFDDAVAAYRAALANPALKDWRTETGKGDGRAELGGYALLRIAIATAAANGDPTAALDAAIQASREPLWVGAAEEFRRGFQDRSGVHSGCVAVTNYLTKVTPTADNAAYVKAMFEYGFANPGKTYRDICPL